MEETQTLDLQIQPLLADLLYPSESDEAVMWVTCYLGQPEPLIVSQITDWLMQPPGVLVEERPETDFWRVSVIEDWFGEDEKKRAEQFQRVQQFIENHLTDRQFFRVGQIEIDLYLLGKTPDGKRAGLKTKVIET
jgi:Nuclease A inhibitor-like protein